MTEFDPKKIKERIMKIGLKTGSGHIPSALTCVDLLCEIYNTHTREGHMLGKEYIVILSKGHGALAQYVILNEMGFMSTRRLNTYHKDGGLSEHTTLDKKRGIYASTGSLGHGLGIGLGYAIANPKMLVHVVMGDGELDEGSTMEALKIMADLNMTNLRPYVDVNGWQGFRATSRWWLSFNATDSLDTFRPFHRYNSIKGYNLGKAEDTVGSHYVKIDQEVFDTWTNNTKQEQLKMPSRSTD